MDRKESIKTLLLGTLSLPFVKGSKQKKISEKSPAVLPEPMNSPWAEWPDMPWVGPAFWGNRLQDWRLSGGKVECIYSGSNRNLHCLTHQLSDRSQDFTCSVEAEILNQTNSVDDYVGFRLGAKSKDFPCPVTFEDYRRTAVYGEGLDAGITTNGNLFIGEEKGSQTIDLRSAIRLEAKGIASGRAYKILLTVFDVSTGRQLGSLTAEGNKSTRMIGSIGWQESDPKMIEGINPEELVGNVALVSHFTDDSDTQSVRFSDWQLAGGKFNAQTGQTYGPILFAQYTLDRKILKMTAQLAPVETIEGYIVSFEVREDGHWKNLQESSIDKLARTVEFRFEDWPYKENIPYRVRLELPLINRTKEYMYEGTIAGEPLSAEQVKAAMFSCNNHHGFPDTEVVRHVAKHRPDLVMFLGDQIYESHGGFGVERSHNLEKSTLDYLRKWYMFGWSYRDIFRNIPCAYITDDHDVFQGNIWGSGGRAADVSDGFGSEGHDTGGYTMLADWVKMIERTQTSHLPDPYDPTPVNQGIGVYYTDWTYGGISFALLEDRKWKTAPGDVLPTEIINGFIQDPNFDVKEYYDINADLLGERQERFLEEWIADWSNGAKMKAVVSQSPFCGVHTLPEGDRTDSAVPTLAIPERGDYQEGLVIAEDMDTNGWPPKKRDEAVRTMRKAFALHIAGDQHLASLVQYGVDDYNDSGFVFTTPALNNKFPRRWFPPVGDDHRPLPGKPKYTGNFRDAFNNCMTVVSVANPVRTKRVPPIIYDRVTGYGIVNFNKKDRTVRIECWPRYIDPETNPEGQYDGWPLTLSEQDSYGREVYGYLPQIDVNGLEDPVIQVYNQGSGELEYSLRMKGHSIRPKVFENGLYKVRIGDPDLDHKWQEYDNLSPDTFIEEPLACNFR